MAGLLQPDSHYVLFGSRGKQIRHRLAMNGLPPVLRMVLAKSVLVISTRLSK